jgi:hypothetical protein
VGDFNKETQVVPKVESGRHQHMLAESGPKFSSILDLLRKFKQMDIVVSLTFAAVVFSLGAVVVVSTPELFKRKFALNDLLLGTALVPSGMWLASLLEKHFN